jgi:hypothetical protein
MSLIFPALRAGSRGRLRHDKGRAGKIFPILSKRQEIVIANKADIPGAGDNLERFNEAYPGMVFTWYRQLRERAQAKCGMPWRIY